MGVTVAVTRAAANLATGTQDFTTTDLGGLTPVGALFIITKATADGTPADHAIVGIGAATGSSERWACSVTSEHGVSATDTNRRAMTDECVCLISEGTGTVDGEADFDSFITNGVRINWGNAPASAYLVTVLLLAGTDTSAYAGVFTGHASTNGVTDVTDPGFQPAL